MSYNEDQYFPAGDGRERQDAQPRNAYQDIVSNGIPKIRVMGVGGAGNNAVNRMIEAKIVSAEYISVNTDAQVLLCNKAPTKIQIGVKRTRGLGAGAEPEVGREAAEESKDQLARAIDGTDLLFITAGMGGGTGTGAAPVIAKIAQDKHILTVAVVTKPFAFEGRRKMENAIKGIENLRKYVDTLVIIPNEKIREVVDRSATVNEAFAIADDVLRQGIRGIADLIVTPGLINCDFADVRTVLEKKGLAHMGVGVAKGENRIVEAVKLAVNSPLLETTIEGAKGVIVNVVGGPARRSGTRNGAHPRRRRFQRAHHRRRVHRSRDQRRSRSDRDRDGIPHEGRVPPAARRGAAAAETRSAAAFPPHRTAGSAGRSLRTSRAPAGAAPAADSAGRSLCAAAAGLSAGRPRPSGKGARTAFRRRGRR